VAAAHGAREPFDRAVLADDVSEAHAPTVALRLNPVDRAPLETRGGPSRHTAPLETHGAPRDGAPIARGMCARLCGMGILGRLSTLIKSNLNDAIDGMQDPGKELDQMVRDMEESARAARSEVAACMGEEKRLGKRVEAIEGEIKSWGERAETAVRSGDDGLAKEALRRRAEKEAERAETQKALQEQSVYVGQLATALQALEARVKDVKLRQGTLRERARAAKGASPLSGKTSAFDDFERMSTKIDAVEAEAGLADELSGRTAESVVAERKLEKMASDGSVDDALAALKKKLGGG
jgi:phage shock protein A